MPRISQHSKRQRDSVFSLGDTDKLQIGNPLIHKDLTTVKNEAIEMAIEVDGDHPETELFIMAAEIARDPPNFSRVRNLTPAQRDALGREKGLGVFKQPKAFNVTMALLCLSALIQGWVESTSNVANLTWPKQLNIVQEDGQLDKRGKWIFAATSAAPFLSGSISALLFVDSRFLLGRRGVILFSGILCFIGAILAAIAWSWQSLLIARLVWGVGLGSKASVTAIFAAEISPSHIRGRVVMSWQLFVALGVACGFLCAAIVTYVRPEEETWRWQTATTLFPLMGLLSLAWVVEESPRYYIKKGNLAEAFKTLCSLRENRLLAARDLTYINAQIQVEIALLPKIDDSIEPARPDDQSDNRSQARKDLLALQERIKKLSYLTRLKQIFVDPRTRRATLAAIIVMLSQQLCGINSVMFYSSNFLQLENGYPPVDDQKGQNIGLTGKTPYWLNFGIGAVNFVFTAPAFFLVDKKGRRWLLLVMAPFLTLCMLGASLSFRSSDDHTRAGLAVACVYLFVAFYSMGQGPVAFTYASEVFPLVYREAGFGVAVFANFLGAGLLGLLVPHVQLAGESSFARPENHNDAQSLILGMFAVLNLTAFFLIWAFVRDTSGSVINPREGRLNSMDLEELNCIFEVPTMRQFRFYLNVMLPWQFREVRWIIFHLFTSRFERPSDPPRPWRWEELNYGTASGNDSEGYKDGTTQTELEDMGNTNPTISGESLPRHYHPRPEVRQRLSSSSS